MAERRRQSKRCVTCKKAFDARSSAAKYCSDACRNRARRGTRGQTAPPKKKPATKAGHLSVVDPNTTAPDPPAEEKKKPLTVTEATETDDPLEQLLALRRVIARDIDSAHTPARDRAALSRQLLIINQHIEAYRAADGEDPVGDAAETPDEEFDEESLG